MRHIKLLPSLEGSVPPILDVVDTMPKGKLYPWPSRSLAQIDTIVIHHFASEASLLANANYHINGRGWRGLGYHIVIDNGKILQTNDLSHTTNHTTGYNERSIGISIRGDLSKRPLTDLERRLLYAAIVTLKSLFPRAVVKAHNECAATSCPCTSITKIREDVFSLEQEIEQMESEPKKEEVAFRIANTTLYYYNMAKGKLSDGREANEGQRTWAMQQLLKLQPEMTRLGMLK